MKRLAIFVFLLFVPVFVLAQSGTKKRRPLPHEYGQGLITTPYANPLMPSVPFDHWLHRAKFTCRVCHVDIGFAMRMNGTGIRAEDIMRGFYCGSCHNGKMDIENRKVFKGCEKAYTEEEMERRCKRCHSVGEKSSSRYDFYEFTKEFPKERFGNGIDWEQAEAIGKIKPADYVEGMSFRRKTMEIQKDFDLEATVSGIPDIIFSHKKHTVWNGCEGCHPEIFAGIKKGTTKYSMVENFEGRYCGQCHLNVAFPMTDCQRCHTKRVL
jgi:c(7)-type cytochrome triheme protein